MKLDTRQVRQNVKLDQLGTALNVRLDTALNLINDEITLPLRMIASDTPNLVLNIGPISIKTVDESISPNIGHGRTRTVPPINGVLPVFTGATVTFPSASGGSISSSVTLVGGPYTLTVASGNWIKVGISLTETGGIYLTFGTAAATEATAGLPDFNTGYFPVGYVSLQNVGGTIQTVTNARIYQFIGGGTGAGGGSSIDRVSQAAHGFVVGDLLYLNGSTYAKASAAAGNTAEIVGIVSKITSSSAFELTLLGEVSGLLASSFDSGVLPATGDTVFLSATAGKLTLTEPSVVGQVSLPVGVMSTANSVYFKPSRGVVIGGANVRTQIGLANATTTTIQNASAYSAGQLSGWIFIDATTDLRFYIQAQFAKNGAGTDYNLSYQTTGDTPPAGFNISITTAGVIQVTLPSVSGYSTASINFALNAPAVGATLPLSIDSSNVSFSDIKAASSAGITFKEDGGAVVGTLSDNGTLMMQSGVAGAGVGARFNASNAPGTISYLCSNGNPYIGFNTVQTASSDSQTFAANNIASRIANGIAGAGLTLDVASSGIAGNIISWTNGITISTAGACTLGPSGYAGFHSIKGGLDIQGNSNGNIVTYRPTTAINDYLIWCRSDVGGAVSLKWRVEADGDTVSSSGSYTSDERAKKNLAPIEYGLSEVMKLQPKSFNWWHEEDTEVKSFCVSTAQEVEAIMPEMVRDDGLDGPNGEKMKAIYDKEIVPVLVKAIQEQQALIEKLEARIAALETK